MIDYYKSIMKALEIMNGTVHFSNHLGSLFSWHFGSELKIKTSLIIFGAFLSLIFVLLFNRCYALISENLEHLKVAYLMYILSLSILTLLFNDPSPDYRLIILVPFLIVLPNIIQLFTANKIVLIYLSISVFCLSIVLSWSIYYLPSGFPVTSPFRALLLFVLLALIGIFLIHGYLFKTSFSRLVVNCYN